MTISVNSEQTHIPARWSQIGFLVLAVLFNLCLIAQLLTVGLAIFDNPDWWNIHVWLVRSYGGLVVILMGWVFLSAFPPRIQMLTGGLAMLLVLQFLTIHLNRSLSVLHPLTGFMLLSVSSSLVHRAWRMVFPNMDTVTSLSESEISSDVS